MSDREPREIPTLRVSPHRGASVDAELGLGACAQALGPPSGAIVGIDLGSTNSSAAVVRDGHPYVIRSREGHAAIPSMVAVNARHRLVVGQLAKAQLLSNPKDTVCGAKRLVGRPFDSKAVQQLRGAFAYEVVEGDDGMAAVQIAGQRLSLEQVSALVLREVKEVAQDHLGERVNRAVITVPAHYTERQREAVRRAGALAGLHVDRLVNEPTAAALAYAYGRSVHERVLVYDLGGGTFDASILDLGDGVYEVVSTGGDTFLGGLDFDRRIAARLLERFEAQAACPFEGDPAALSRLAEAAERAKHALSERQEVRVQLPFFAARDGAPVALDATLTRAELVELVAPLVDRTLEVCCAVLAEKGLAAKDIDAVILVGGQSRMPLVHERVRAFFGRAPSLAVNPEEAVAIGAALLAHSLGGAEGAALIGPLPLPISVVLPDRRTRPLFDRGAPLPARRRHTLSTAEDGQTSIELRLVHGEAVAAEREMLGTVRLQGLPAGPRGMVKVAVTFELGVDGLLAVSAREVQADRPVRTTFAAGGRRGALREPVGAARARPVSAWSAPARPSPSSGVASFLRRLLR